MQNNNTLVSGFSDAVEKHSDRPALQIKNSTWTYQDLSEQAHELADFIKTFVVNEKYIGILSSRSIHCYLGILASLLNAKAYLPIDLKAHPQAIIELINQSACKVFIINEDALPVLVNIQHEIPSCVFICPKPIELENFNLLERHQLKTLSPNTSQKIHITAKQGLAKADSDFEPKSSDIAYVLFTSGSTGKPKGVPISHKNICAYINQIRSHYPLSEFDRCTQAFELTFDPSVHDMFVTWFSGACLYVMNETDRLGANYFIRKHSITVWNTLPSIVKLCLQMRSFNSKYLSTLQYTFFNGEPLSSSVAVSLQERSPETKLINLYGLTETTVNLFHYVWNTRSENICKNGIVPIGQPFSNVTVELLDGDNNKVNKAIKTGHLSLSGDQIFSGYLELTESESLKNKEIFYTNSLGEKYMMTGDIVELEIAESVTNNLESTKSKDNIFHIVGRNDEQIKLNGHRIDLNAIRFNLEKAANCIDALVLVKQEDDGQSYLVGFLKGNDFSLSAINEELKDSLPAHAQLEKIYAVNDYPYLVSGKINKKALLAQVNTSS